MYQVHSYHEVVFSVKDLGKAKAFYTDYVGAIVVYEGKAEASQASIWGLPEHCQIDEVLLEFVGNRTCGKLRLLKFHGVEQTYTRSGGRVWDTGGIYDIDLRVNNIDLVYDEMRELGWHGENDPVELRSGGFILKEVVMKGHDDIVLALVNRTYPPMGLDEALKFPSNIYLSALICKDLEIAKSFFIHQLGFQGMNDMVIGGKAEQNMFGLPENIFEKHPASLNIISPNGERTTMLDLIQFENLKGRDFTATAVPPNRGILMFRFPVTHLQAYYEHILNQGITPKIPLQQVYLNAIGEVNLFAVVSPDGVWLEFYEKCN